MTENVDLTVVNDALGELGIDFQIKPVGRSGKIYWLHDVDNLYAIKLPVTFVQTLEKELKNNITYRANLHPIFGDEFIGTVRSSFAVFSGIGFIAKDYAELYIACQSGWSEIAGPSPFFVGSIEVWLSSPSSLQTLLNERYNEYGAEMDRYTTVCLKGTSQASLEDDLSHALYYLDLLMPFDDLSFFDDKDRLCIQSIKDGPIFSQKQQQRIVENKISYPKPAFSVPVKYFVQAERLTGEVSILYYYKVLEYFFALAWRQRIMQLVSITDRNESALAEALEVEQPKNELSSLQIVISAIVNDTIWGAVRQIKYCSEDVNTLAKKLYKTRNEVAHGKEDGRLSLIIPSMMPLFGLQEEIDIFRLIAREALSVFGGVESGVPTPLD